MLTLFIASDFEAEYFIKGLNKKKHNLYECKDYRVLITGMGLINTAQSCTAYFAKNTPTERDEFINVGICGSVTKKFGLGEIVQPKTFSVYSTIDIPENSREIYDKSYPVIDRGNLHIASSITPVWGADHIAKLKSEFVDLIDMEAYAFASVSAGQNIPFKVTKSISDYLIKKNQEDFIKNASKALKELKAFIFE